MPDLYTWIAWAVAALAFVLGVQVFGVAGLLAVVIVALCLVTLAGSVAGRRVRRRHSRPDPRFLPTTEIFVDPTSRRLMRVFVDPRTGERRYRAEG